VSDDQPVVQLPGATAQGTLQDSMGIVITEASPERVAATMPVAGNIQPYGLLHGGASCVLAETLGSIGSGRTTTSYEIVISDERDRRVCTARITCQLIQAPPGS